MSKDAKYLIAYITPLAAFVALWLGGWWSYLAFAVAFILIPVFELILPPRIDNLTEADVFSMSSRKFFDWLLYLNLPIVIGLCIFLAYRITHTDTSTFETIGMTLGVGIVLGACGINVAHELGHRETWYEQLMAMILLAPAMYTHFTLEHNYGHHKNVGTPADSATARLGETLFYFWVRSVSGAFSHAWKLQLDILKRTGKSFWSMSNTLLMGVLLQLTYLVLLYVIFGLEAVLILIVASVIGILLLESVNYIEHYGLVRNQLASGRYEPVNPTHSWNSDHQMGRIFLYELTRHSDHHFKSTRKYQVLRHMDDSPQLPYGYPASIILAMIPPLWMRIMHKRIEH